MLGAMSWTAPEVTRQSAPYIAGERRMLEAWLLPSASTARPGREQRAVTGVSTRTFGIIVAVVAALASGCGTAVTGADGTATAREAVRAEQGS
jgi:hypothetical protein